MSKDVLFKTSAFGGFKKDEVMDFVQQVLGEKGELERLLLNNTTRNNQLSAELNNVKAEIDSLSSVRDELADSLIKVEDLTNALKEKDAIRN